MFVNDTSRLPESGRVCVMGHAAPGAARRYYAILVNAARAEVEPMAEPRNPAHVLGVGAEFIASNGPSFAAYFAGARERFDAHPDYRASLYVLVDGAVYSVQGEGVDTRLRRGFNSRTFTLLRGGRPQRSVVYPWPWYRGSLGGGGAGSADFMREIDSMVHEYGRPRA